MGLHNCHQLLVNSLLPQGPPVSGSNRVPVISWLSEPSQGLLGVLVAAFMVAMTSLLGIVCQFWLTEH